jgi:hypothetical protein
MKTLRCLALVAYATEGPLGTTADRFWALAAKNRPHRFVASGFRHYS